MTKEKEERKTIKKALKELIAGYDLLNNLKFLAVSFLGLFFKKNDKLA